MWTHCNIALKRRHVDMSNASKNHGLTRSAHDSHTTGHTVMTLLLVSWGAEIECYGCMEAQHFIWHPAQKHSSTYTYQHQFPPALCTFRRRSQGMRRNIDAANYNWSILSATVHSIACEHVRKSRMRGKTCLRQDMWLIWGCVGRGCMCLRQTWEGSEGSMESTVTIRDGP